MRYRGEITTTIAFRSYIQHPDNEAEHILDSIQNYVRQGFKIESHTTVNEMSEATGLPTGRLVHTIIYSLSE